MRQHRKATASQLNKFDCGLHVSVAVVSAYDDSWQAGLTKQCSVDVDTAIDRLVLALWALVTVGNRRLTQDNATSIRETLNNSLNKRGSIAIAQIHAEPANKDEPEWAWWQWITGVLVQELDI